MGFNGLRGKDHPQWRGGKTVVNGYVAIKAEGHPRASRGYVYEHILMAEAAMGKHLRSNAPVHHFDGNTQNNVAGNLVVCHDEAYHKLLHRRQKALAACGNASWHMCTYCKKWDAPENLVVRERRSATTGRRTYHQGCNSTHYRERGRSIKAGTWRPQ